MPCKTPKVSRIAEIPQIYKRPKKVKRARNQAEKQAAKAEEQLKAKHDILSKLLVERLIFMKKGSYKKYKQSVIKYAEYASENYDAVKTFPKNKNPQMSIHPLSPLMPFYLIRVARILITDMFRKKTPAELKLIQLAKEEKAKIKLNYKV